MISLSALIFVSSLARSHSQAVQPTGVVPFTVTDSTIVVPATVNGKELTFMFDTGFGGDVAVDSEISIGKPSGYTMLKDFVGEFKAPVYKITSLKIGNVAVDASGREAIGQPGASEFGEGVHVDGLMGFSVIKDFVTKIDFSNKRFEFYPQSLDISTWKADGVKTFLLKMMPIGVDAIELPVTTADGKTLIMALDTGNAFYATTHKDVLERVGLWPENKDAKFQVMSGVASGEVASWYKTMTGMTIFGAKVPQSTWDVIDLPASDTVSDGTVGFQFLKNFNIYFDFKRRYVFLENWTGKVENDPIGSVGMSCYYSQKQQSVAVYYVAPESPAAQAGIAAGDRILSINGEDLTNVTPDYLRKLLTGTVGSTVRLSVSHDGFAKRITLTRTNLVNP